MQRRELVLTERSAGLLTGEAVAAGVLAKQYAKGLPALEVAITAMKKQVKGLEAEVRTSRSVAVEAAVEAYVQAVASPPPLIDVHTPSQRVLDTGVYRRVVVAESEHEISSYQKLKKRVTKTEAQVNAHLAVIVSTVPDMFLNVDQLQGEAVAATGEALGLATKLGVTTNISAAQALMIVHPQALSASEMAGWYDAQGYSNNTGIGIEELAAEYLKAGAAEGVTGDVAFAQSMLETGGFSVMSGSNNFAGIGACNSCNGGYNYSSYVQGIRAQIQLLHGYADKGLTSAHLVGGASYQGMDTLSVRGCCVSWPKLSRVWASGSHYGDIIIGIYVSMLHYALAHP